MVVVVGVIVVNAPIGSIHTFGIAGVVVVVVVVVVISSSITVVTG